MVKSGYIPGRGDFIWVNLDPGLGHEQLGRRPALVVSPGSYSAKTGMVVICPLTKQIKGYVFEVLIQIQRISGAILVDQVRAVEFRARRAKFIARADGLIVQEVLDKLSVLLGL